MKLKIFCNSFTFLFLVFSNSFCQSNDSLKTYKLENIVVTSTKFKTNLKNSPNKIEIIDNLQIRKSNGNRLPEVLNNSSSIYIKSYGTTPSLKTISINGLGSEHTLILIDGVKINSFQNGLLDLSIIPIENIERIEIVNNGLSSIYGSEAIGGTVNIITNRNNSLFTDEEFNLKGNLGIGSFNTSRYGLILNKLSKDFNFNIFYNKEKSDGNFEYYFNNGIETQLKKRENAAYDLFDLGINSQIFSNKSRIVLYSIYSYQNKQVPTIETGTPPSKTIQKDKIWNNIITYELIFSNSISFKSDFNFQNNFMRYEIKSITNSFYKNIVVNLSPEVNLSLDNFNITTGLSFTHAKLYSNEVVNNSKRNQSSLFVSAENTITSNLKIFSSIRFDNFSDIKKNALTSRIGINFKPFEDIDLNLRANAGNNFRAPTFNDLYWKDSGNPNLKPEKSFNFEAGFISLINLLVPLQFEFTFTHIDAKDKIVWMPQRNMRWTPINIASSQSNNFLFNISFNQKINDETNLRFNSGLNLINSKKTNASFEGDLTKDKYLPYLPLELIKLGLMVEYKTIELNLYYHHTGKRFSDFENTKQMNPFNILDGNISLHFKLLKISSILKFEVSNLTNTDYQTISGYPMPLRNYFLTLSIIY